MDLWLAIIIWAEIGVSCLWLYGLLHEEKVIALEERILEKIRSKKEVPQPVKVEEESVKIFTDGTICFTDEFGKAYVFPE